MSDIVNAGKEMASDTERVTVRIPIETVDALQHLVKNGEYNTLSDAVRAAIDIFIEAQFAPEYIKKMTIELPKGNVVDLQELVQKGDSVSVEDAIRNAVREYVRRRLSKAMENLE